jgi:hypothetical protein
LLLRNFYRIAVAVFVLHLRKKGRRKLMNMSEYREAVVIMGREHRADDYEVGTELHGWKVVIWWGDKKYFHWAGSIAPDPPFPTRHEVREQEFKKTNSHRGGGALFEAIRKWGGAMLIGIGLSQLVLGSHLVAVFFILGGLLILIVQYFAQPRR